MTGKDDMKEMASWPTVYLVWGFVTLTVAASFPFNDDQARKLSIVPRCQLLPQPGLCLAYFERFYYNASTGKCHDFVYGGCRGNLNNFVTEDECMKACAKGGDEPPKIELESLENKEAVAQPAKKKEEVCSLPQEPGLCYALIEKFYFNGERCETFHFGGCGGNKNNFETMEECVKACPPKSQKQ